MTTTLNGSFGGTVGTSGAGNWVDLKTQEVWKPNNSDLVSLAPNLRETAGGGSRQYSRRGFGATMTDKVGENLSRAMGVK